MNTRFLTTCCVLGVVGLSACSKKEEVELSRPAEELLKVKWQGWRIQEGTWFYVHAQSGSSLERLRTEADTAYEFVCEKLEVLPDAPRGHVFAIERPDLWETFVEKSGLRPDGLALHHQHEVYVYQPKGKPGSALSLAHEIVHLTLWRNYADRLPLWLEEGVATWLGWETTKHVQADKAMVLTRSLGSLAEDQLISRERLTGVSYYPDSAEEARVFYQQAEALVRALLDAVGEAGLNTLIREISQGSLSLEEVLLDPVGLSREAVDQIWKEADRRAIEGGEV